MTSTKKFLSALTADGRPTARGRFVMPAPDGSLQFVELLTGKTHLTACVVYTGVDLTADEVVSKASAIFTDQKAALSLAESFLAAIKQFRVGNVVAVESNDGNSVQLRLVSVSSSSPG